MSIDMFEMERLLAAPGKALHKKIFGSGQLKQMKVVEVCCSDVIDQKQPSLLLHPYAEIMVKAEKVIVRVLDVEVVFPKVEVCRFYAGCSEADVSTPQVFIPPSRRMNVSGQVKIAIDVSLILQHVRKSDIVDVVGSGSSLFGGNSYLLLAGAVAQVNLYDPYNTRDNCIIEGTSFIYHRRLFTEMDIVGDVLLNDAFDPEYGLPYYVNTAPYRVYSVKYFDELIDRSVRKRDFYYNFVEVDRWPVGEYQRYDNCRGKSILFDSRDVDLLQYNIRPSYTYGQVSHTKCEVRRVYPARPWGSCFSRLGTCFACIEFAHRGNYQFSEFQMRVWKSMHGYLSCVLSSVRTAFVNYNYLNLLMLKTSDYPLNLVDVSYDAVEVKSEQELYSESVVGVIIGNKHFDEETTPRNCLLQGLLDSLAPRESQYLQQCPISCQIPEDDKGKLFVYLDFAMAIGNEVYRLYHYGEKTIQVLKFHGQFKKILFGTKVRLKGRNLVKTLNFSDFSAFVMQRLSFC